MGKSKNDKKRGFTLIEMLVAVFVFSIVMVIATGAIFTVVSANKTSQALKSVLDNLSNVLDSMSREVRYGSVYHCGFTDTFFPPVSCEGTGSDTFAFTDKNGDHILYQFQEDSGVTDGSGYINRCVGVECVRLTAPEVHITKLLFYVQGAEAGEAGQPKVLIAISGYSQVGSSKPDFNIETIISQRNLMCKNSMSSAGICNDPGI